MAILAVVKDVCATVGVQIPQSIFSGITANRTMQEMLSLANEIAQRIAYDARDWTMLRKVSTFTGNGVQTAFDLPADYKRMLLTGNVWGPWSTQVPLRFVPDTDEWLRRRANNNTNSHGEWTIIGGQMLVFPVLPVSATVTFPYLHRNCIRLNSGGFGDAFVNDNDSFALDERVLKLGMIGQWKANKGSPYAEDMGTFADALTVLMGRDSPAPIIVGRRPASELNVKVAYPGQVP